MREHLSRVLLALLEASDARHLGDVLALDRLANLEHEVLAVKGILGVRAGGHERCCDIRREHGQVAIERQECHIPLVALQAHRSRLQSTALHMDGTDGWHGAQLNSQVFRRLISAHEDEHATIVEVEAETAENKPVSGRDGDRLHLRHTSIDLRHRHDVIQGGHGLFLKRG